MLLSSLFLTHCWTRLPQSFSQANSTTLEPTFLRHASRCSSVNGGSCQQHCCFHCSLPLLRSGEWDFEDKGELSELMPWCSRPCCRSRGTAPRAGLCPGTPVGSGTTLKHGARLRTITTAIERGKLPHAVSDMPAHDQDSQLNRASIPIQEVIVRRMHAMIIT